MDYAELKRLREVTGKSMQNCKQGLENSKNDFELAAQNLFAKELVEIESCSRNFDIIAATKALIEAKGNVRGALSILAHGRDIFESKEHMGNKVYDKSKWHYDGVYPKNLPPENASIHIGMFITWCIENGLLSSEQLSENAGDIKKVKSRKLTGANYLINDCDETFSSDLLNDEGNEFAKAYYENETAFTKKFNSYGDDFCDIFNEQAESNNFEYESLYHVEDTWKNYDLLKPLIEQRYHEWTEYRKTK